MLSLLLHRLPTTGFYRVEITDNLFGEYTVQREWGRGRQRLGRRMTWFGNLRDAVEAADRWGRRAQRRGYRITERRLARG